MKKITQSKLSLLIFFLILVIFFLLRLPNLTIQPIFADEAIYIRWAQLIQSDPNLRFVPLSDGKTPLYMWTLASFFRFFKDPLLAGRVLSIISGFFTLIGVFFLGWRFFNKRVGLWAAFLVAVTPFMVFFDRMALVDSMLAAFTIWALNMALLLTSTSRLDVAMFLGYFYGGALLTKTPGLFSLLALPTTLVNFDWSFRNRGIRLAKMIGLMIVSVIIAMAIYNILKLGPGFPNLNSRDQDYVLSIPRLLSRPWDPFIFRIGDISNWFIRLWGLPLFLLTIWGLILAIVKRNKVGIAILLWVGVSLIPQMIALKVFTARYVLPTIPPFLVLAAWGLDQLLSKPPLSKSKNIMVAAAVLIFLVWPLYFDSLLLLNPQNAPLPQNERQGYFEDWTAGYGLTDIAAYLENASKNEAVVVATGGNFGTLPDGLEIYLNSNPNVDFISGPNVLSTQIRTAALTHPTYYVADQNQFIQPSVQLRLIKEYPKAIFPNGTQDMTLFFEVLPTK